MSAPEPRELQPLPSPPPGLPRLRRRLAGREAFRDALLAALAEVREPDGSPLGGRLDVAGDPTIRTVSELWARVADSLAAYTELTAGERYLGTAQDWTDVRRTIDLVGYRPTQRAAAHGWIRCTTDTGASPLIPAGTRVQAPGTASRPSQTFEVAADTQLRADWANLTVTGVPQPAAPTGSALRFLADPGFAPPDRILLVRETPVLYVPMPIYWGPWLLWVGAIDGMPIGGTSVVATVSVRKRTDDLGATLITVDRELTPLLPQTAGTTYAAYRVRSTLELAHRLEELSYLDPNHAAQAATVNYGLEPSALGSSTLLVTDASQASTGMHIIVSDDSHALVTKIASVSSLDWSVAPGTKKRIGKITLTDSIGWSTSGTVDITLVDDRKVAQHYELPTVQANIDTRVRIHPRPDVAPAKVAVQTTGGWQLVDCSLDAADPGLGVDPGGMLLALAAPLGHDATTAPATANLAPIQHGTTKQDPLRIATATTIVPGPVTADVGADGSVTDSLILHVDGVRWDEVGSLYGRGADELVYASKLAADGRLVLSFGDGKHGAQPRGAVTGTWRIGGGLEGELDGALIDTLLGSVRGVRKIAGVGLTSGAADQEDPLRMRRAAAARIRALDRAVSLTDLADLALTVPGVSHAAAWRGAGPADCPCGGVGLHVASLRLTALGVRAPLAAELTSLAGFLDARRDTSIGLCVCAGVPSGVAVTASVAVDPRRDASTVGSAVQAALTDPAGPLAPNPRELGVPIDDSDVVAVAQPVSGVLGVVTLTVGVGMSPRSAGDVSIGRTPAARYELLYIAAASVVTA
jgi:hypothetical protein